MIGGISPLVAASSPATKSDPKTIQAAAGEFEALLIGSLLKSMRESGSTGWLGTGEDKTSESLMGIAEEQVAQLLSAQGGLGLARMISQGLSQTAPQTDDAKAPRGR